MRTDAINYIFHRLWLQFANRFEAFSACMQAAGARVSHLKGRSGSLDVFIS